MPLPPMVACVGTPPANVSRLIAVAIKEVPPPCEMNDAFSLPLCSEAAVFLLPSWKVAWLLLSPFCAIARMLSSPSVW